jgi:dihydrofolate synthase/folylpolyglutamate synthase
MSGPAAEAQGPLDYDDALARLYGLANYEHRRIERYDPETLDLARMERLLGALGDPHRLFPSLHVAGTKGKGSVAAMAASVLRASGLRTGLYTSPHLHDFRERVQINGRWIGKADVTALVRQLWPVVEAHQGLTWFDVVTALAFLHFAQRELDFAVIEVGLGGRLDSTNVITPLVSVITSISYDHTYLLGDTLAAIASEKAGIMKPAVPVVSAPQADEALLAIRRVAAERHAPLTVVGRKWRAQPRAQDLDGQGFTLRAPPSSPFAGDYWIPLLGRHQLENAAVAAAALDALRERSLPITQGTLREGLRSTRWPGRLEVLRRAPLVVVDAAHNGDSAERLGAAIADLFRPDHLTLIFGASSDKDIAGMLAALVPMADRVILTRAGHPRAADPEELADQVAQLGGRPEIAPSPAAALASSLADASARDLILATGSLFIVAEVREAAGVHVAQAEDAAEGDSS